MEGLNGGWVEYNDCGMLSTYNQVTEKGAKTLYVVKQE